ncbi:oxygen-independent coproporphyrinogen III oxidase [Sphingobium sufflavum]|uniref:oxygen-independent coproporphyrinogen III oxidase n=1 Tax=Sphingobium sufflavum TaxID=1129547 RepID=UPI001F2C31A8|nr:oxygen-independent coproporphyrinogen III oxidase [Sphingobium sufflavum]MCE7796297.1 oxygen-independent coproporphyrinogen III oxidase [Sphingobium sufflavum]
MTIYHPDLLARAVPRYTSYPTAADFTDGIGPRAMTDALAAVRPDEPLSLYVHIPFCQEICAYCGCNTGRANRPHRLQSYLDALDREIDLVADALAGRGRVTRIAFGGGSPNALDPRDFARLTERLATRFAATAPILSIELDPRTLDRDWLDLIGALGVARASLGVQSFDPAIQQAIGRVQPDRMIADAVAGLRGAGVSSINLDLMYGLPAQSLAHVADSITRAVDLGADRAALFGYAHLPAVLHRQRAIDASDLPDTRIRFAQAALGRRLFLDHGYRAVGFDHFARPGDPMAIAADNHRLHRNFQGFTDDGGATLIGLGASAISQFRGAILQNEKQPGRYRMRLSAAVWPVQRGVRLTPDMRQRARVIEGLLCHGVARPGIALLQAAAPALDPFVEWNLARIDGDRLHIAPDGWPYARLIAAAFDAYRPVGSGRFSHAV